MEIHINWLSGLLLSIAILGMGKLLSKKLPFLTKYNIPDAVTGGILFSTAMALLYFSANIQASFDMGLRDMLMLAFFSTIGLSAKFKLLRAGGKTLALLIVVSTVFLFIQDFTGVFMETALGGHPLYGLFGGSISLAGGYGTVVAWGDLAHTLGIDRAEEVGVICATFGLIAGGMIGGPLAEWLITKNKLIPENAAQQPHSIVESLLESKNKFKFTSLAVTLFLIVFSIKVGLVLNNLLLTMGLKLPTFLTSMFVAIGITNAADVLKRPICQAANTLIGDVSLPLFLSMSLMSMQLWTLKDIAGPLAIVLMIQVLVIIVFVRFIIFNCMGKDYDASVISAGFIGFGLGATPIGLANMNAITHKYGPSPKAFLVIPLVGAFFIDIINALVINFFASWPMMTQ